MKKGMLFVATFFAGIIIGNCAAWSEDNSPNSTWFYYAQNNGSNNAVPPVANAPPGTPQKQGAPQQQLGTICYTQRGGYPAPGSVRLIPNRSGTSAFPLPTGTEQSGGSESLAFSNPVIVIRAPYRVSFSYAGRDRVWRDNWPGQTQLPRAVRIQVRDNATSALQAVSTSTLIHTQLPPRCAWFIKIAGCPELGGQAENGSAAK